MKNKIIQLLLSKIPANIELALQLYKGIIERGEEPSQYQSILILTTDSNLMLFDTKEDFLDYAIEFSARVDVAPHAEILLTIKNYYYRYKSINEKDLTKAKKIYYFEEDKLQNFDNYFVSNISVNKNLNEHITGDLEVGFSNVPF